MTASQLLENRPNESTLAAQREAELEMVRRAIAENWEEDCSSDAWIDLLAPCRQDIERFSGNR